MYYFGIDRGSHYLFHHGIQGMKWGIRRFQNSDGSLTAAGKKRYSSFKTNLVLASDKYSNKRVDKLSKDPGVKRFVSDNMKAFKQRSDYGELYNDNIESYCGINTKRFKKYVEDGADYFGDSFADRYNMFKADAELQRMAQQRIIMDDCRHGVKEAYDTYARSESYLNKYSKADAYIHDALEKEFSVGPYNLNARRVINDAANKCYLDNHPNQVVHIIKM